MRATKRVPIEEAKHYGLFVQHDTSQSAGFAADGMVEIPRWRHAIINFPHPLLEQGLVILDTPGLNAIGTEPELTLNLLPNAHAVLFVLAVDTGVSKTDAEVWREYTTISTGHASWERRLEAHGITRLALSPSTQAGLVAAVRESPNWQLVYEDRQALVFSRTARGSIRSR